MNYSKYGGRVFSRRIVFSLFSIAMLFFSCSAKNPQMVITPAEWSMGTILGGSRVKETFWIKNIGTAPLVTTFRSNCDCIEILAKPDTIAPGDSSRMVAKYSAGTEEKDDKKSIFYTSNDKEMDVGKIPVTASIVPFATTPESKTISMIPITVRFTGKVGMENDVYKYFGMTAENRLGFTFVNSGELTRKVIQDPEYSSENIAAVVRKWAGALGIRYTVMGELSVRNTDTNLVIIFVDALFEYPITRVVKNPQMDRLGLEIMEEVDDLLKNIGKERRDATIQHLQNKWYKARQKMIGKASPEIDLADVLTGDRMRLSEQKGHIVFIHFFSIDCEHCEEEIEWVEQIGKKLPEVRAYGIAVDIGEKDSVVAYVKDKAPNYPILLPEKNESYQLEPFYGGATPQSVIIDQDGIVREVMVGFNRAITIKFAQMLEQLSTSNKEAK